MDEQLKMLISAYVDGEVTQTERAQIEKLIQDNGDCQKYYQELKALGGTLKTWPEEKLSADLERKIHQALPNIRIGKGPSERHSLLTAGVGGGFLILLITAAFVLTMQNQSRQLLRTRMAVVADKSFGQIPSSSHSDLKEASVGTKDRLAQITNELSAPQAIAMIEKESVTAAPATLQVFDSRAEEKAFEKSQALPGAEVFESQPQQARDGQQISSYKPYSVNENKKVERSQNDFYQMNRQLGTSGRTDSPSASPSSGAFQDFRDPVTQPTAPQTVRGIERNLQYVPYYQAANGGRAGLDQNKGDGLYSEEEMYDERGWYDDDIPEEDSSRSNTEEYQGSYENPFMNVQQNPLSTFSIDVDTASYSNIRRFLLDNQMPPVEAVRIEEMINYFDYNYPQPSWNKTFSITTYGGVCPWNPSNYLVQIGIKGKVPQAQQIPPSNLVFLIDVSGSMNAPNKLPLLKEAFRMLVNQLGNNERVAIVTYNGSARLILNSTPASDKYRIISALESLQPGGSTAGSQGIQLAYQIARENFIQGGNNRIILATDGDFNIGLTSDYELVQLIERKRREGVFLSILGFGTGNLKDSKMEQIADKGNGNYFYIDSPQEAHKITVEELGSTLFTIAKDVKIQVEFNPQHVSSYRLIGYENRALANRDFQNDRKDAGELGAGHTVTAFYEIVPNFQLGYLYTQPLKYQKQPWFISNDLMTVKLRYKEPDEDKSQLIKQTVYKHQINDRPAGDFIFASAVVEFGLLLRNSPYKGQASYLNALQRVERNLGEDENGYRRELLGLIEKAKDLDYRAEYPAYPMYRYGNPLPAYEDSEIKFKHQ